MGERAATHHGGCWRIHHECALRRIEDLERAMQKATAAIRRHQARSGTSPDLRRAVLKLEEPLGG